MKSPPQPSTLPFIYDEGKEKNTKESILGISTALILLAATVVAIYQMRPPDPVPASAPKNSFSSERALQHLKIIAARPHPIGSPEHADVREYIVQQLTQLGLTTEVQVAQVQRSRSARFARFATVKNVVSKIPGTQNSRALLLLSHYDTVPNSPGATDDGSGVVTVLETARALQASSPLKNDVILLFTDGEEIGLMGAKAFVEQHPWANEVGLVLNFEGSGSGGPVIMFETSDGNARLIDEFAKVVPYPVANSLSYEIYKRMPNDTDLTIFKNAGIPALNFAYIDNRFDYHTNSDNLENVDEGSLQHHGSYALSLTKRFGNLDLGNMRAGNAIYFDFLGLEFLHYSTRWIGPLLGLTVVAFLLVLLFGLRAHLLSFMGIFRGSLAFLANLLIIPPAIASLFGILSRFFQDSEWWLLYYRHKLMLAAFALLAIAMFGGLLVLYRRGTPRFFPLYLGAGLLLMLFLGNMMELVWAAAMIGATVLFFLVSLRDVDGWNLTGGHLFGWLLLTVGVSIAIPGASFLFIWPFLLTCVATSAIFLSRKRDEPLSTSVVILLNLFAIPAVIWFSQVAYLIFIAMGINLSAIPILVVTVVLGLLVPHLRLMTSSQPWLLSQVTAVAGVACLAWLIVGADFDARHRKPSTVFYAHNADSGESVWATTDKKINQWALQYFTNRIEHASLADFIPTSSAPIFKASAGATYITPPEMWVLSDQVVDSTRSLHLVLSSARGAPYLNIFLSPDMEIRYAAIDGMEVTGLQEVVIDTNDGWWRWRYFGLPKEGIQLQLVLASQTLEMKLLDVSYSLPQLANLGNDPPPSHLMPAPYSLANMSIACKTYTGKDSLTKK